MALEASKTELLETLWMYGQRRIDRARLRQHVAEKAKAKCEALRESSVRARERAATARERLRRKDVSQRGGKPLAASTVAAYECNIRKARIQVRENRASLKALEQLIAAGPHELAREFGMGCARVPTL